MTAAMKIPAPPNKGKLLSVDATRTWIEERMPGKPRSRQYVYRHVPTELRVNIGAGLYFWEEDLERWFMDATRGKR